jgi:hypothetical protein
VVDKKLVEWIKVQKAEGYDNNTLKTYLISHGYDVLVVKEALKSLKKKPLKLPLLTKNKGEIKGLITAKKYNILLAFLAGFFIYGIFILLTEDLFEAILAGIGFGLGTGLIYFFDNAYIKNKKLFSFKFILNKLGKWNILLFSGSLVFMYYFMARTHRNYGRNLPEIFVTLLLIIFIFSLATLFFRKYNKKTSSIVFLFAIIIAAWSFFSIYDDNLLFFILPILALLHALKYYFCSSRKEDFLSTFSVLLVSLTFAAVITELFYLFVVYVPLEIIGIVHMINLSLIMSPVIIVFLISYFLISKKMLEKCFGEFNHFAFFRFKHIPGRILNFLSNKEGNLKKTIIKATAILFIIILLAFVIFVSIWGTAMMTRQNDQNNQQLERNRFIDAKNHYERGFYLNGFEINKTVPMILDLTTNLITVPNGMLNGVNLIFYDCVNLNCKNITLNPNQNLAQQINLQKILNKEDSDEQIFFETTLMTKSNQKIIFIPSQLTFEQVKQLDPFEFENLELKNSLIVNEIREDLKKAYAFFDVRMNTPESGFEKFIYFYGGQGYEDITASATGLIELSLRLGRATKSRSNLRQDYALLKEEIKTNQFYDGTTNIDQHIQVLKTSIELFYPAYKQELDAKENKRSEVYPDYWFGAVTVYERANSKLAEHTLLVETFEKVGEEVKRLLKTIDTHTVNEYSKLNIQESKISKVLRLRMLNKVLISKRIDNCKNDFSCQRQVIYKSKDVSFCRQALRNEQTQCYSQLSLNNKKACKRIIDHRFQQECLAS